MDMYNLCKKQASEDELGDGNAIYGTNHIDAILCCVVQVSCNKSDTNCGWDCNECQPPELINAPRASCCHGPSKQEHADYK